ncbi:hypothetical protein V9L20_24440 [Variovorax sp. CCNWLW225]|uniref:hypothetical protein n=1 Tax=unclassified Variovorax TaxID=663243 RepID=UPI00215BDED5|nr:hypothetical protein [Variovorax sp. S12S4]MCR8958350.1 hypothetical protein [Variovorax sp. S12S4]
MTRSTTTDRPATPNEAANSAAYRKPTPAEKSMKREAKTPAENGDPVGPNNGPSITGQRKPPTPGDAGVGETDNHGSSPYSQPGRPEKPFREE